MNCPRFPLTEITPLLCHGCFYHQKGDCVYLEARGQHQVDENLIVRHREIKNKEEYGKLNREFFERELERIRKKGKRVIRVKK